MNLLPTLRDARGRIRNVLAIRLRTLLILILLIAAGLGWGEHRRRRRAIDALLSAAAGGVFISISPTHPWHNSVFDGAGTLTAAIREVKRNGAETGAAADLILMLKDAREHRDQPRMRGALAGIQGLNTTLSSAGPEVARVARGEGLEKADRDEFTMVRGLALHVLGILAREDQSLLPTIVEIIGKDDPSAQSHLKQSAANELAAFGPKAKAAMPILLAAVSKPVGPGQEFMASFINVLGAIGPEAHEALPMLRSIALDRERDLLVRSSAAEAFVSISAPKLDLTNAEEVRIDAEVVSFLSEFAEDDQEIRNLSVDRLRLTASSRARIRKNREETKKMIAYDRSLGGRPRPKQTISP